MFFKNNVNEAMKNKKKKKTVFEIENDYRQKIREYKNFFLIYLM